MAYTKLGSSSSPQNFNINSAQQDMENWDLFSRGKVPKYPGWTSLVDSSGQIASPYRLGNKGYDTAGLEAMKVEATRAPGTDSIWRNLQQGKLESMAGRAASSAQAQTANAQNQLAMRGGLRGGAAERLAGLGAQNALKARQDVLSQGTGLDIADEENRLKQMGAYNQAALQSAGFTRDGERFNIQNALTDIGQKRSRDLNMYNQLMRAWGAKKTADASRVNNKNSGLITDDIPLIGWL